MNRSPRSGQLRALVGWLLLSFVAAAVGGFASANAASFYGQLTRPGWAPPAWLFGPAWTVLYLMMAVAAWLVWREGGWHGARTALTLFVVQLVANGLWSWLFFAWHRGALAFADVVVLWLLIVATIAAFWRVSPLAAVMLVPYLAWVTYAAALTLAVWRLNPSILG